MRGIYAAGPSRAEPLNETPAESTRDLRTSRPDSKNHRASTRRIQSVYGVTVSFYEGGSPKDAGFVSGHPRAEGRWRVVNFPRGRGREGGSAAPETGW